MSWWSKIANALTLNDSSSAKLDPWEHIRHVVLASGLANNRPEDIDFFVRAFESKRLNPRDVRRFGAIMTSEEKAETGLPANLVLAREFVATLNEQGLENPEGAALKIAWPAAHRCHVAASLLRMKQSGVNLVRFRASGSGAGPCAHAAKQDGARVTIAQTALPPFDDCSHPEQCSCVFQPWQNIADDMDDMMV